MKTSIFKASLLLGSIAALASCDDVFEPALENINGVEKMYTDASYAQGILGNAYLLMPYQTTPQSDLATDDAVSNDQSNSYLQMAIGNWTSDNDPLSQWKNRLNAIQYANIMVANASQVQWSTDEKLNSMFIDLFQGDAYGMRALQMFYLLRAHAGPVDGQMLGVPILREYQDASADFNQPRATFRECIDSIMIDIERALTLLPYQYGDITDDSLVPDKYKVQGILAGKYTRTFGAHQKGKINGQILQALRAQVALLAASPAYAEYSGVTMADAAKYAAIVIDGKEVVSNGYTWFCNTKEIAGLQKGDNAPECIWQTSVSQRTTNEANYYPPSIYGGGDCNPSQNLVDAFPMLNGYPISDSRSGYDANDPYTGRDGRLSAYILYDGQTMGSGDATITTGTYKSGNVDGLNYTTGASTRTGYYLRKLLRPDVNLNPSSTTSQQSYDARIRYTEIFLDFAEAANEAVGPNGAIAGTDWTAKTVIKALRERAGICTGSADPYLDECASDQTKMRELIRNERRLELCFENHRFYDLRRWKVDLSKLNETVRGAQISQQNAGFTSIDVETRNYKDYQYYGPIPYSEVIKYSNLQQNQGW